MHEIKTVITVNDVTETEVVTFDFSTQEEVFEFLTDYVSMEASRLYGDMKPLGDRTTVFINPCNRKSMTRTVSGTTRRDGRKPIEGNVTITVRRIAA